MVKRGKKSVDVAEGDRVSKGGGTRVKENVIDQAQFPEQQKHVE